MRINISARDVKDDKTYALLKSWFLRLTAHENDLYAGLLSYLKHKPRTDHYEDRFDEYPLHDESTRNALLGLSQGVEHQFSSRKYVY